MSIVGTSMARVDAPDKATGRALYTADYSAPGMLRVALARAKTPHALIRSIEIPDLPEGVFCFTAKDLKSNLLPSIMNDQPVLAEEKIRFAGEPFAIVAAGTREEAEAFAASIELVCDPLPVVDDMQAALEEDAPRVFEKGNLCSRFHSLKGDPGAAFADCSLILEDSYEMPVQSHAFLEPESAFTRIDEQGRLALISSTQNAFADRSMIASVLGLPEESIASRAATVGGAFGGKDGNTAQIYPAVVTHFTRRPAQYIFTREENIRYGLKRHSARVWARMGFDKDGKILAFEGKMWMDTGAYAVLGPAVLELGTEHMTGPYYIPNVALDGWLAYTNHTPASAFRGFGAPQSAIAVETLVNRAAEQLGLNQLEIRRRNAIHRGQASAMGSVMEYSVGFEEMLDLLEKSELYREMNENPEPGCGYGLAAGLMSSGMGKGVPDCAVCEIERLEDESFNVRIGLVDLGQGGATANVMMAADALGVTPDRIHLFMGDSDTTVGCGSTAASRSTYVCGNAILMAAKEILAGRNYAKATFNFPEIPTNDGVHSIFAFIAQLVKLRVDPVTGAVRLLDVMNVTEAGRIINPTMMAGQIYGGIAMSTGYTLSEQVRCRNGRTLEDGYDSYILSTALDAPRMRNENVDFCEESGPFGAKGTAEPATIPLSPAVAAALRQLCPGLNIRKLPINREEILAALPRKEQA